MPRVDLRDSTITMTSSLGTLSIKMDSGNAVWDINRNVTYVKTRGRLDTTVPGDEEAVTLKIEGIWLYIKSGVAYTIEKFLLDTTDGLTEPSYVDIQIGFTPLCNAVQSMTYTFQKFRYENINCDPKTSTIGVSGKCNILRPTFA